MKIKKIKSRKMKKILFLVLCLFGFYFQGFSQETYKVGNTEYYYNKTYSTTGKPMVKRSEANKTKFLNSLGYTETPLGYEIDHVKPLSEGGTDDPWNMQLLTKEQHAKKTAQERTNRSSSTYNTYPSYKSTSPNNYLNNYPTSSSSSSGKIIYTGQNGGKYYINSNGNKTYIKSNTKSSTTNFNYTYPKSTYNPSYNSGKTIHTGSRGDQYYINSNGNKSYIKK